MHIAHNRRAQYCSYTCYPSRIKEIVGNYCRCKHGWFRMATLGFHTAWQNAIRGRKLRQRIKDWVDVEVIDGSTYRRDGYAVPVPQGWRGIPESLS